MSIFKGKVDSYCTLEDVTVYNYYECTLNQTDIKRGSNKFYIMQILKPPAHKYYYLWTRYGRVGEKGNSNVATFESEYSAIRKFEATFRSKTGNRFNDDFVEKSGKYTLIDLSEDDVEIEDKKILCNLDPRLQNVLSLISNNERI